MTTLQEKATADYARSRRAAADAWDVFLAALADDDAHHTAATDDALGAARKAFQTTYESLSALEE